MDSGRRKQPQLRRIMPKDPLNSPKKQKSQKFHSWYLFLAVLWIFNVCVICPIGGGGHGDKANRSWHSWGVGSADRTHSREREVRNHESNERQGRKRNNQKIKGLQRPQSSDGRFTESRRSERHQGNLRSRRSLSTPPRLKCPTVLPSKPNLRLNQL